MSGGGASSFRGVSDKTPLMADEDGGGADATFKAVCDDLTSLLAKLSSVNEALGEWAAASPSPSSPAVHHTLQVGPLFLENLLKRSQLTRVFVFSVTKIF